VIVWAPATDAKPKTAIIETAIFHMALPLIIRFRHKTFSPKLRQRNKKAGRPTSDRIEFWVLGTALFTIDRLTLASPAFDQGWPHWAIRFQMQLLFAQGNRSDSLPQLRLQPVKKEDRKVGSAAVTG
jgi:hypothetical protein